MSCGPRPHSSLGHTACVASVVAALRYPVKSARAEASACVEVEQDGVRGDRAWACLDRADGTVGSAKHPRRWGRLLEVTATTQNNGDVAVAVAGRRALAGSAQADALLSQHLGRAVTLTPVVPEHAQLHRQLPDQVGLVPAWMNDATPLQEVVTTVTGARPGGRFVDYGAVHVITTGAVAELAARLGRAVLTSRFRPNLIIDASSELQPGQELRVGDVVLRVVLPTPRCVVPGLDPDGGPSIDHELLRVLSRHHRVPVAELGRAACFGAYAEVLQPGRVRVGDDVR